MTGPQKKKLSAREQQVADYLCEGLDSNEIAEMLDIDQRTVQVFRHRILKFTGAKTTAKLVVALHQIKVNELKARISELELENETLRQIQTAMS